MVCLILFIKEVLKVLNQNQKLKLKVFTKIVTDLSMNLQTI